MRRKLTAPEYILWEHIKTRRPDSPVFRRQYALGPYILDFYCIRAKLAIEVDGGIHSEAANVIRDTHRDAWLNSQGVHVYRVPAVEIFTDVESVADGIILMALERLQT
jgi:very-short-patch-repair endonuclease